MAATTLTAMPSAVYAGDTLLLSISDSKHPASDGWTLTYVFAGGSDQSKITFSSTADGDKHAITVSKADTALWVEGTYKGIAYCESATQRETVWTGYLIVNANYSEVDASYDPRSHAQKCLDSINAVLEGKATRDVLNSTIAGQTIGRMSFAELLAAKQFYQDEVNAEIATVQAEQGKTGFGLVKVRFSQAT